MQKKGEMILPSLMLSNAFWKVFWILQTAFKQNNTFVSPHNSRLILYGTSIQLGSAVKAAVHRKFCQARTQ